MQRLFGIPSLDLLAEYFAGVGVKYRKAGITLARSGSFPDDTNDPVLLSKTAILLNSFVDDDGPSPEYSNESQLKPVGNTFRIMASSPLLRGLLITIILDQPYPADAELEIKHTLFFKEHQATQTRRLPNEWNWDLLFNVHQGSDRDHIVHPLFPNMSSLQYDFSSSLNKLRNRLRHKIILPHSTTKGVSRSTSLWMESRYKVTKPRYGTYRTIFRNVKWSNVTSTDVVRYFIRTGVWPKGKAEIRQRWYPSQLLPRTYFAWGGDEICVSTYLREIFNWVADSFPSTHRLNRVKPDWLRTNDPRVNFYFYDLTSFTSWFHEQVPLLRSMSKFFMGTDVLVVSEGVTLREMDVGQAIQAYIGWTTDFPDYGIGLSCPVSLACESFTHYCAGFLGVPGNLVTCTIGHGLAQSFSVEDPRELQVPGDDVGVRYMNAVEKYDRGLCANTLGLLQMDKVYDSEQRSVYLKREVNFSDGQVFLTDMLIFPLLPFLISPDVTKDDLQSRFRYPSNETLIRRACSVLNTFYRDLWRISRGEASDTEVELIYGLLLSFHDRLRLPYSGVLQGRVAGDEESEARIEGVAVKYPLDRRYLRADPHVLFSREYVEVIVIRDVQEEEIVEHIEGPLAPGMSLCVRMSKGWSFLEKMGYIEKKRGRAGTKVVYVGTDAQEVFLSGHAPPVIEVEVLENIEMEQLVAVGIVDVETGFTYIGGDIKRNDRTQLSRARGYLLSKYVDLDKPSGPLIGSRVAYDDAPWVYGNDVGGVDQAYDDGPVDYEHLLQY
jgi:hypothetical protein